MISALFVARPLRSLALFGLVAVISSSLSSPLHAQPAPPAALPIAGRGPAHWADKTADLPNEPVTAIAVDPFDDAVVYAGFDGFLFKSDDGGESWSPILSFPRGLADDGALDDTAADAFDGAANGQTTDTSVLDAITGSTSAAADLSTDTGDDADEDEAALLPEGDDAGGNGDDPLDTVDVSIPARLDAGVRGIVFVPGSRGVFLVATSRGLFRTTSAGQSFARLQVPGGVRENDIRDVAVEPLRPSRLWIGTGSGLFTSIDGGTSMDRVADRLGTTPIVDLSVDMVTDTSRPAQILVGSERGLARSRDGGLTFNELMLRGAVAFPLVHAVGFAPANDTLWAGTGDGLFVGVRGAAILERYTGIPETPPAAISPDPLWAGGVAVAVRGLGGSGVVFSDDAGLTAVDVDVLPAQSPAALARETTDPARLWVASDRGVFRLEPGTGIRISRDELAVLRQRFEAEPDIGTVTTRVLENHGFLRQDQDARVRAQYAPWLPKIDARYWYEVGDVNQTRNSFIFRDPSTLPPIIDPDLDNQDLFGDGLLVVSPTQRRLHTFYVNFVWDLDKLILNSDVLRSGRQVPLLRNAERSVVDRTRQLYVNRRRLVAELLAPSSSTAPKSVKERIASELRLLELEAQLAALCNEDLFAASH
ncbi:MAG TPA: hypothetical protein VGF99_20320 [Myxococcota bacterium]